MFVHMGASIHVNQIRHCQRHGKRKNTNCINNVNHEHITCRAIRLPVWSIGSVFLSSVVDSLHGGTSFLSVTCIHRTCSMHKMFYSQSLGSEHREAKCKALE